MVAPAAIPGPVQLMERTAQRFDFVLILNFLPLGELQRFEHFVHLIQHAFEFGNHDVDFFNGFAHRRNLVLGCRPWRVFGGTFTFRGSGNWRGAFAWRLNGLARTATARMSAATAPGTAPVRRRIRRLRLLGCCLRLFVRNHALKLPGNP